MIAPRGLFGAALERRALRSMVIVGVVLALVGVALFPVVAFGVAASPARGTAVGSMPGAIAPAPGASTQGTNGAAPPPPSGGAPSSGRGTFFLNQQVPIPPLAYSTCTYSFWSNTCLNNTGSPSIVSTPSGVMAVAYTAFTNTTVCPADNNLTFTEIGLTTSVNGGGTWSSPSYMGNPDCTQAFNYTSAMSPSITALGNGTLVLAYIEYNVTVTSTNGFCQAWDWFPSISPCDTNYARLVVTESYDNGTTWTLPAVINASANPLFNMTSWMPAQPSVTAVGSTVYLAWTNETLPYFDSNIPPSIGLNMVVSTDGGQTWGAPVQLPVENGPFFGSTSYTAYAPAVLVGTTGTVYVAYSTKFQENITPVCIPAGCSYLYPQETMDVVVAHSTDNGSTWTLATVASNVPVNWNGGSSWTFSGPGTQVSPAPAIAQDTTTGELYVAYTGTTVGLVCFSVGSCYVEDEFMDLYVSHSHNSGATWSAPLAVGDSVLQLSGGATGGEYLFDPAIGVGANGTVYAEAQYTNMSSCSPTFSCGLQSDVLFVSTNHGTSFPQNFMPFSNPAYVPYPLWDGFYSSMTIYQGIPYFAWTQEQAPPPGFFQGGTSQVIISSPFDGVGITVSFNESGLPLTANWSISLAGNVRAGPAGTSLVVSGVPTASQETWTVPWANASYGHAFASNVTPLSPGNFSGNTTVNVTFDPYVLLNIFTVPPAQGGFAFWCGGPAVFFGDYCGNQEVNPIPGATWLPMNSTVGYNITDTGFPLNCYYCYNYTFLAWTGVGAGSWNTTNPNGSAFLTGPVNETASFAVTQSCQFNFCTNITYDYVFNEVGLPANTSWQVTFDNQVGQSILSQIGFVDGAGPYAFTVWTVPFNATQSWVGTPEFASPITSLEGATDTVRFVLMQDSAIPSDVTFGASGLPAGVSSWGLSVDGTNYGVPLTNATLQLGSGAHVLNGSAEYGPNEVGAYLTGFRVVPESVNGSAYVVAPGASVNFTGPATVTALYAPEYWVSVSASTGGTTTPSSVGWVASGVGVTLNASANVGYAFVGWTGTGVGSVTATTLSITINPGAPVTELASFVAVVPTYTVQVSASGLLAGIPLTVTMGTQTYTDVAPFSVSGLVPGSYALNVPTVYPNGTYGVRYDPTSVASSLSLAGGSLDVTQNGTLSLGYTASYSLTIAPSVNGTTSPSAGTYWEVGATAVSITATADAGHSFAAWIGLGPGSVSGASSSISVTPTGPVTETPSFATNPPVPPAVYTLTLTVTGLPAGTSWTAAFGSNGVAGVGSLVLGNLNGSVTLTVPIVPGTAGVRYVPSGTGVYTIPVHADTSYNVSFSTEFALSVATSSGGTVTPATEWVASGASVALAASASADYVFENWTGSGSGSYTGTSASTTLTVSGPVTELATFVPASSLASPKSTSSGASAWIIPIALLVVLLIVGLVAGLLIGRRPPAAGADAAPATEEGAGSTGPVWDESSAPTPESPAPDAPSRSGGTDGESIYGGGSA